MDNKKLRDICGVVIFPILTAIFFICGALFGKQGLIITGCTALVASLIMQFLIMNG